MISFKELRYVTLVNKYKNFSQAAKHAGVSQPALSMAISNLEEKLGVVLFTAIKTAWSGQMCLVNFCPKKARISLMIWTALCLS